MYEGVDSTTFDTDRALESDVTTLDLSDIRSSISEAHSALETELSATTPDRMTAQDASLLRMGQDDVNYAFTDTLEQGGIESIEVDTQNLSDPRTTLGSIYSAGDTELEARGLPSPDVQFYHDAAEQAQASGQDMQEVLTDMRDSQPLMMRENLTPPDFVDTLPDTDVVLAQANLGPIAQETVNENTSRLQQPAEGAFTGDQNYCKRSAADINLENHSPNGNLVDATDTTIDIYPRAGSVPSVSIPNTVGADGYSTWALNDHVYNVYTDTRGMGLTPDAVGQAFRDNPTPGDDNTATPEGTPNNVGGIPRPVLWDNAHDGGNWVNSFSVPSPDPEQFTDITVNYTRDGEHLLHEGYVMRYGVVEDGEVVGLRSYGEGHAWEQSEQLSGAWCQEGQNVWEGNHQEIIEDASAGID